MKIETNFGSFTYQQHPIRIEDKIMMDYPNRLKEFFYTPEESINIERVKLIDKILNDN